MKKEDFTDRLIRRFFGVMGPFDELRQQIIHRVAARAMVQILYSIFALSLLYFFIGRYFTLVRDCYPLLVGMIVFGFSLNARRQVKVLELENDDESEITYPRFTHKQIMRRTWLTFIGFPTVLILYSLIQRSIADKENFLDLLVKMVTNPLSIALLVVGLFGGGIFAGIVYASMSEWEKKE